MDRTMTLPASILIVDDDRELGQMLTEYLSGEGFQVSVVRDGAEALERLTGESHPFDLVILDVMLPSLSGFEVLRRLRHSLSVPVIMLTAHGADVDRIVGLELGADDYLSKPFNPRELVARVRAVLRRFSPRDTDMPAHPVSVGPLRLDPATFEVTLSGESVRLTGTELRLLEVLMRAVGQVQSRESLTERVLGRRLTPYDRSIDTHVSNLRRKLGLGENGLPEIRSIRGAGYVLIFLSFWAAMLLVLLATAAVAWYRFNKVQSVSIDIKALANEASARLLVGGLPALHDWIDEAEDRYPDLRIFIVDQSGDDIRK